MKTKFLVGLFGILTLLILAACAPGQTTPTSTLVRLERAETEPIPTRVANVLPTPTPIPPPSPTPTFTAIPLFLTPTPLSTTTPLDPQAEVIVAALNVRQGPGLDYPPIGAASAGDRFKVIGLDPSGYWLQVVTTAGDPGWISAQPAYTRLLGVTLNELPFVEPPLQPQSSEPVQTSVATKPTTNKAEGLSGKLVLMTGSGGNLYLINADGTNLRRLAGGVIDPVLSPDGQQAAFVRWDGADMGTLYTINLDGSGERVIVGDMRRPKSPTWSPDGEEIILSFQYGGLPDPKEECREFDFDDGVRVPKDIGQITKSRVSRDGIVICYIRREDLQWRLRQINVATGKFEDLPGDEYSYNPAWDPHNPWRVIYDGSKGLMQLDVTNGNLWPITGDLRDTGPVFSPDSRTLALTYKQHDHWEVYTLDLETGQRHRLTKPPILADPQYNSAAPAWSPDGSHLVFVTNRTGQWEIWVMKADGSDQHPLFSPEVQAQLGLEYHGVNERMLNWAE